MLDSDYIENAKALGTDAGRRDAKFALAEGIYGEPRPPLSGEWADDLTPQGLYNLVLLPLGADDTLQDAVCDAYEDAYYEAYEKEDPNE